MLLTWAWGSFRGVSEVKVVEVQGKGRCIRQGSCRQFGLRSQLHGPSLCAGYSVELIVKRVTKGPSLGLFSILEGQTFSPEEELSGISLRQHCFSWRRQRR